jgi:hypothetical protein
MATVRVKVHARKPDGLRRGGMHWPVETVERDVDIETAETIEREPLLDVCRLELGKWVRTSKALAAPEKSDPTLADMLAARSDENMRLRATNIELAAQLERAREALADAHAENEALTAKLETIARADEIEGTQEIARAKAKSKGASA